jgi:hypothetical protein
VISFKTSSTRVADSVRDKPTFWYTASHKSARVTVFPVIARPAFGDRDISLNYQTVLGWMGTVNSDGAAIAGDKREASSPRLAGALMPPRQRDACANAASTS